MSACEGTLEYWDHRTYREREKWERWSWRSGSCWVCAWVGLWLCLASFIHPGEPPSDTSMKTQNSVIHSLLVLHAVCREKEQRRWLKRKSKEHFTSSMEATIKKKKKITTGHFPIEGWFPWPPEGLIPRSQISPFSYSQYFLFLRHVTSQLSLIKTFTYDPIFLPNIRKLRHHFSAGQYEHLSDLLWSEGVGSDGGLCSQNLSQISGSKWGTSWYHFSFPIWTVTAKHQTSTENENDLGKTGIKIQ